MAIDTDKLNDIIELIEENLDISDIDGIENLYNAPGEIKRLSTALDDIAQAISDGGRTAMKKIRKVIDGLYDVEDEEE